MGVNRGTSTLYHLTGLTKPACAAIWRGMYEAGRAAGTITMTHPTVDGDSNNIAHVVGMKSANKSAQVGLFYSGFANYGAEIVPMVDGDERPTSKQATNERIAKRELSRTNCHI